MKNLILALMFVYSGAVLAADNPDWAYPVTPPLESKDNVIMKSVPGSTKQYTQAQIDDIFNPPDWYPNEHPPMPQIVTTGGTRPRTACALCHLPSGDGHPEIGEHCRVAGKLHRPAVPCLQERRPQGWPRHRNACKF